MVIWIIGLSGSGKTTLGREVVRLWKERDPATVLLDGDEFRALVGPEAGGRDYTLEGRRRNAERMAAFCEFLDRQQVNVVCCILSLFPDQRAAHRQRFSRYVEVFLDASLEALEARDPKGHYAAARAGRLKDVAGVDLPFPRPEHPDLVLDTSAPRFDLESLARQVLQRADVR